MARQKTPAQKAAAKKAREKRAAAKKATEKAAAEEQTKDSPVEDPPANPDETPPANPDDEPGKPGRPAGSTTDYPGLTVVEPTKCPLCKSTEVERTRTQRVTNHCGVRPNGQRYTRATHYIVQCGNEHCRKWRPEVRYDYDPDAWV